MEDKKITGSKLPWMWYDQYGVPIDPDIGPVSQEDKLRIAEMFKAAMPRFKYEQEYMNVVIVGTGGSMEGDDISKMFYNPTEWNTTDVPEPDKE